MSSSTSAEKPTSTYEQPIMTEADKEDDWEIVDEKESRPTGEQAKKETDLEKGTEDERKRETKAKWEGMQQQSGGVYPHREVKVPSYPKFIGDW